jgi:hypothetical protein
MRRKPKAHPRSFIAHLRKLGRADRGTTSAMEIKSLCSYPYETIDIEVAAVLIAGGEKVEIAKDLKNRRWIFKFQLRNTSIEGHSKISWCRDSMDFRGLMKIHALLVGFEKCL